MAHAQPAVGEGKGTFAVNIGGKEHQFHSGNAYHVGRGQEENRSRSAGEVGDV